jgi:hypothetical protein
MLASATLGTAGTFLFYTGFIFIGALFVHYLCPETMGLGLEQIDSLFVEGTSCFEVGRGLVVHDPNSRFGYAGMGAVDGSLGGGGGGGGGSGGGSGHRVAATAKLRGYTAIEEDATAGMKAVSPGATSYLG